MSRPKRAQDGDRGHVRISKLLSLYLRHQPQALGLTLEPGGYVPVDALLAGLAREGLPLTREQLAEVVARSDKQRFAFDETGARIRANQGHSAPVDLQLAPAAPPPRLYHGTVAAALPAIRDSGLRPMARHHVHLSPDEDTARRVGQRRGRALILVIDAAAMHRDGLIFYRSQNGVWLTDAVPPRYLSFPPRE